MIKDRKNGDYFNSIDEFKNYLSIIPEIEEECTLSVAACVTEQDFVDFANEYELKANDGIMTHEYAVI